jgi:hypothetical protein
MFFDQSCHLGISNLDGTGKAHHFWKLIPASLLLVRVVCTMEKFDTCLVRVHGQRALGSDDAHRGVETTQITSKHDSMLCWLHRPLAQCIACHQCIKVSSHHKKAKKPATRTIYTALSRDYAYSPSIISALLNAESYEYISSSPNNTTARSTT